MKKMQVSDVHPGAYLAKPVLDSRGRVLLRRGACLSEGVLKRLEHWKIETIHIQEGLAEEIPEVEVRPKTDPAKPTDWLAALESMYAKHEGNEEMDRIRDAFKLWCRASSPNVPDDLVSTE